jgi:hypothetical protein
VVANDNDSDGGPISITSVTQPANGTVVITGGGTGLTYQVNPNYCNNPPGTSLDTFTYTLSPGGSSATVTMTVTCVNDDPNAEPDAATTDQNTSSVISVLDNDTDIDSTVLTVTAVTQPAAGGSAAITGAGTTVTFDPGSAFRDLQVGESRDATFTYTISDGDGGSDTATVTVTVNGLNDAPTAVADPFNGANSALSNIPLAVSTSPSGLKVSITGSVLANDSDIDGDPITAAVASGTTAEGGSVSMNSNGSFTYVPPAGYLGSDSFTYTVSDDQTPAGTANGTVTITVVGPSVWFVDPTNGADTNTGTSASPFQTLAPLSTSGAADALDDANDVIFVYRGTAATNGIVLEAGQRLVGEPQGLSVTDTAPTPRTFEFVAADALAPRPTISGGTAGVTLANGVTLQAVAVQGGAGSGIVGTNVNTATIAANVTLQNNGGVEFDLSGGGGDITVPIAITNGTAGRAVSIANRTSGTVTFSGAVSATGVTGGTGVNITNNTGATVVFSGGLTVTSGANQALNVTGGGTLRIPSGNVNTLASTTGTTLTVANTTIGAGGLNLRSVSTNGAVNGIVLTNTGSTGSLVVTGTGSSATGGTITTTGTPITLSSTLSPSFDRMALSSSGGAGVSGALVDGFTLANSSISLAAAATGSGIDFGSMATPSNFNVRGAVSITNTSVVAGSKAAIDIYNETGTISNLTITGVTITNASNADPTKAEAGIRVQTLGNATTAASVTTGSISSNSITGSPTGSALVLLSGNTNNPAAPSVTFGSAALPLVVNDNDISGVSAANLIGTTGIASILSGRATGAVSITNNDISHTTGIGISAAANGAADARFTLTGNVLTLNNTVGSAGIGVASGSTFGFSTAATIRALVQNNTVSATDGNGILIVAREGSSTVNASVISNNVAAPVGGSRPGIRVDAGNATSTNDAVCLRIENNISAGSGGVQGIGLRKQGTVQSVNVFGVAGAATPSSQPAIEAYVVSQNPVANGALVINGDNFQGCTVATP